MLKGLSRWLVMWLLALVCGGCAETFEKLKPDRVSVGVSARQLRGSNKGFKVDTVMPVWEIRAKKKLADNLDAYVRGQFNKGTVSAAHPLFEGEGEGYFAGAGGGINYFPFRTHVIGLDAGLEAYHSGYDMRGGFGPIHETRGGRFSGGGINLGAMGEIPLDKKQRWSLIWGAGHNFTATKAEGARANLSGWYGTVGLQLNWGNK